MLESNIGKNLYMKRRFLLIGFLLTAGLVTLAASTSADVRSEPARVTDFQLEVEESQVRISFQLSDAFTEDFLRRVDSGVPTGFVFEFELVRDRKSWFDSNVASGTLRVDAMYNAVTREYLINYKQDGNLVESRVVREPDELQRAMTEFADFLIFAVEGKAARQRLRVRVRAVLGTRMFLFFIPRTQSTPWVESPRFQIQSPTK